MNRSRRYRRRPAAEIAAVMLALTLLHGALVGGAVLLAIAIFEPALFRYLLEVIR